MSSMGVVEKFGGKVGRVAERDGQKARKLMLAGYAAQQFRLKHFASKLLTPSRQYLAWIVMQYMRTALLHPDKIAMTSLFIPCDPLIAIGYKAFSIEGFSAFMTGTRCEMPLLDAEDNDQNLCSYHRIFLGASKLGLLPVSPFGLYTNVACDANMVSFPALSSKYHMPTFFVDVPYEPSDDALQYVEGQLRGMVHFIEDQAHVKITDDMLANVQAQSRYAHESFSQYMRLAGSRYVPTDVTSGMYEVLLGHMMLGTKETAQYYSLLAQDYLRGKPDTGLRLLWIHAIPFSQAPVRELLNYTEKAHIVSVDLAHDWMMMPVDPANPYETMARRMVYCGFNGAARRRIEMDLALADMVKPHGAIMFNHWGCKMTLGASALVKQALEEKGIPVLLLDGDGADMRNQSDGQTETRLGAFLEMLEARR